MFYATAFDPLLIISQIMVLQSAFYILVGLLALFFSNLFGSSYSLNLILSSESVATSNAALCVFVVVVPFMTYIVVKVVQRSRKCLDFVSTTYILHVCMSWAYCGTFPSATRFWVVNVSSCTATIFLSEYFCFKKEMEDIPMTGGATVGKLTASHSPLSSPGFSPQRSPGLSSVSGAPTPVPLKDLSNIGLARAPDGMFDSPGDMRKFVD